MWHIPVDVLYYFYRMKKYVVVIVGMFALLSCKSKKKFESKGFISIVSLIRKQVAHIDTSLYTIIRTVYADSTQIDSSFIPREQFANLAKDFLEIPDLSDPEVAARFKAEESIMDETINRVIITYVPIEPVKEEFKIQQLLGTPVIGEETALNNIIVTREISNRDSFVHKKMLWQMDRSFQVTTTRQKPGQPEVTTFTKVTWNEDPYQ